MKQNPLALPIVGVSLALICFFFRLFILADIRMGSKLFEFAPDMVLGKIASHQFGVFGVIIGYVLAFIGALNIPADSTPNVVTNRI